MSITNLVRDYGVDPAIVRMATTDNYATITTPGYLSEDPQLVAMQRINGGPFFFVPSDVILANYSDGFSFFILNDALDTLTPLQPDSGILPLANGGTGASLTAIPNSIFTLDSGGDAVLLTNLPIALGGTGVSSVTTTPTANAFAGWNVNQQLAAHNFLSGYTTTATNGGTTTLTAASNYFQFFTGSSTETVVLPVTSTLQLGQGFFIVNRSSGAVTVTASDSSSIQVMAANTRMEVICISTSVTSSAGWDATYLPTSIVLPITVPFGGTGKTSLTAYTLLAGGTTTTGAIQQVLAGSAGQVLQSGGASALPAYSTATYPATTTVSQLLYSSSSNVVAGLATANNGLLVTSASGVPSIGNSILAGFTFGNPAAGAQQVTIQGLNTSTSPATAAGFSATYALMNQDTTDGNYTNIVNSTSVSARALQSIAFINDSHTNAQGSMQFLTRNSIGGGLVNAMTISNAQIVSLTNPLPPGSGGTGINNGVNTLTLAGNLATSGAFASTFTMTGATNVTFPTSGTLATTAGTVSSITGTANQIVASAATGDVTLSLPQSIGTGSAVQFASVTFGGTALANYLQGTFTPTFSCNTPGDLSVVYTVQDGFYTRIGNLIWVSYSMSFTPTFTTASGNMRFLGMPVAASASAQSNFGITASPAGLTWGAGYTQLFARMEPGTSYARVGISGSTQDSTSLPISALVSGAAVYIIFAGVYMV